MLQIRDILLQIWIRIRGSVPLRIRIRILLFSSETFTMATKKKSKIFCLLLFEATFMYGKSFFKIKSHKDITKPDPGGPKHPNPTDPDQQHWLWQIQKRSQTAKSWRTGKRNIFLYSKTEGFWKLAYLENGNYSGVPAGRRTGTFQRGSSSRMPSVFPSPGKNHMTICIFNHVMIIRIVQKIIQNRPIWVLISKNIHVKTTFMELLIVNQFYQLRGDGRALTRG